MTIPSIRKRAKHAKVKSGCRTCKERRVKCDEIRPVCQRCIRAGRECTGYDTPSIHSTHLFLAPKTKCTSIPQVHSPRAGLSALPRAVTAWESHELSYFCLQTVKKLAGNDWRLAWHRLVLPLCQTEPVVVNAAIALGSLDRALVAARPRYGDEPPGENYLQVAEIQYNRTIASMRQCIESLGEHVPAGIAEAMLVVSLLLFNFDLLAGQDGRAKLHLRNGLRILYQQAGVRLPSADSNKRVVTMRVDPRSRMDLLTHTFVRLEADLSELNDEDVYLSPVCDQALPVSFLSVEQAQVHLDVLENMVYHLWCDIYDIAERDLQMTRRGYASLDHDMQDILAAAAMRTTNLDSTPEVQHRLDDLKAFLVRWTNALSYVPAAAELDPFRMHVEIHFFYLWAIVNVLRDADELGADNFEEQFKHFLGVIERYFDQEGAVTTPSPPVQSKAVGKTRPGFAIGTCTGLMICLLVELCRTSWIRRRGVALLRAMDMRGVYDSDFLASYYEAVIDLEEDATRQILGNPDVTSFESHEIPSEARVLECDISDLGCSRKDYYRQNTGRMLFVKAGEDGVMEVYERTFHVTRPAPTTCPFVENTVPAPCTGAHSFSYESSQG